MAIAQPETFVLTDQEAAAIQAAQSARQASVAQQSPVLRIGQIGVPVILVATVIAFDQILYDGTLPAWLILTVTVAFVAGMFFQTLAYKLTFELLKRRVRQTTRQYLAPRTVLLTEDGIDQTLPDLRSMQAWSGIDRVDETGGLIMVWAGNLMIAAIPIRSFQSPADAKAFLATCQQRAGQVGANS